MLRTDPAVKDFLALHRRRLRVVDLEQPGLGDLPRVRVVDESKSVEQGSDLRGLLEERVGALEKNGFSVDREVTLTVDGTEREEWAMNATRRTFLRAVGDWGPRAARVELTEPAAGSR